MSGDQEKGGDQKKILVASILAGLYSTRKAMTGSTRDARHAGTLHAINPVIPSSSGLGPAAP